MFELDLLALPDDIFKDIETPKVVQRNISNLSTLTTTEELMFLNPFSDNNILKPSWSKNDFAPGQVWAVYYGNDLMPRVYTQVNNTVSGSQVCVTLLESLPTLDHEIHWKKENLPIVNGIFKVSGTSVNIEMSKFSHLVPCRQSVCKSFYKIYPLKGEIWAMYKKWNIEWKQPDHNSYQCQIVEILSGSEGDGITVARLGEVKGCLTFFHRQQCDGFDLTHAVSRVETLSFSHRIPAFRVPGIGKYGIPESSWHLEPKALIPIRKY
ncbi:DUF3444 domain-containing protein [Cephalotus follicularis]|uniref:DUF3444 domain-containing protein n=1 Tax=Cephalotus follicularis TaxID=3775 RepID=A0A1Q3AWV8_CEPFO|nr:DUF3444 domain-containing protein [Cephalotus follicularis]